MKVVLDNQGSNDNDLVQVNSLNTLQRKVPRAKILLSLSPELVEQLDTVLGS